MKNSPPTDTTVVCSSDDLDDPEQKNDSALSTPPDPFEEEFGHLITVDGDKVKLNQPAIAAKFAKDMNVRYSEDDI